MIFCSQSEISRFSATAEMQHFFLLRHELINIVANSFGLLLYAHKVYTSNIFLNQNAIFMLVLVKYILL